MEPESNLNMEPDGTPPPPEAPPAGAKTSPGGSRVLTIGILMAAVAMAFVFIRQDAVKTNAARKEAAGANQPSQMKIGAPAPKLVLKDLNGNTVNLADLKGKVVMVDFWATWCEPCQIMIPWMIQLRNQYGSQGFEIVGVAMDDEGLPAVKPFAAEKKMNYPIVLGNEDTAQAWGGIFGMPTSFIIDRDGNVRKQHLALVGKDELEKDIKGLL